MRTDLGLTNGMSCGLMRFYLVFELEAPSTLSLNQTYKMRLEGYNETRANFASITIPASKETIKLDYYSTNVEIVVLVQLKESSSEVADTLNSMQDGISRFNLSGSHTLTINSNGTKDVSVSFLNLNNHPVFIDVSYWLEV
jgi:hypothetical protein